MSKIRVILVCLLMVPMLFAAKEDSHTPDMMIQQISHTDNPADVSATPAVRYQTQKTAPVGRQTWETYAAMPTALYYNAAAYCNGVAYNLGGYTTVGVNTIYAFDCGTETWSTVGTTLNHTIYRHAAATVNGKIYVIGGSDGSTTYSTWNQEFDPVAVTVTDRAPLPVGRYFLSAVAWRDSLIYVLGGQATTYYDRVDIYDPATNTWTTGTNMPTTNRSFACGISGDTIYYTGGYSSTLYQSASYMGIINPANPTSITWTQIDDIPLGTSAQAGRSRVQGACVNGYFYFTGGDDHGAAFPAYDCWYYDPVSTDWVQMPNKPTPISNSQCAVAAPALDNGTFLCTGGYNVATSSATANTEGLIDLGGGGGPAFWDFEDGWQGWTHTSALTFPAAWDVVQTTYAGGP
ncbi:MAG: hypothetical protein OEV79_11520, partial [candidate division WOR-3 bacterium]|nr:hypothetical protein [candidate division WOR-3 bacterium]